MGKLSKRILVLTDSMSLPRDNVTCWSDTYVNLLRKSIADAEFIHLGIGKATISDLLNQLKRYYQFTNPDIIILHCGIVDCAPRALHCWEQKILSYIPFLRDLVYKYRIFLRKVRQVQYTSISSFEDALLEIKKIFDVPLISIGMAPPSKIYRNKIKVSKITKIIMQYNEVLKRHTKFIDLEEFPHNAFGSDGYHFNKIGHSFVAQKLVTILQNSIGRFNFN